MQFTNWYRNISPCKVLTLRCFVASFKGDWKYMTQLFNLSNTPSKEQARSRLLRSMARNAKRKLLQTCSNVFKNPVVVVENLIPEVCWSCRASKGSNGDMNMCYVNVGPHAGWRDTIGLDSPWQHKPSFADLVGFNPLMISLDLLHIWHLGLGREPCLIGFFCSIFVSETSRIHHLPLETSMRFLSFLLPKDLCGAAIKSLVQKHFWNGTTQDKQLAVASKKLKQFAKSNRLPLQLKKFTKANLGWSTGRCPELGCKGYDTYVVLSFLVSEIMAKDCGASLLELVQF